MDSGVAILIIKRRRYFQIAKKCYNLKIIISFLFEFADKKTEEEMRDLLQNIYFYSLINIENICGLYFFLFHAKNFVEI
jgi:hypothetical protein